MKLQDILLEKLPGGVKAKMLELTPVEPGQWKFTLRLVDPILSNVAMKWGYVTTALDSEDFDRKRVSNYYNQFKTEVLDNATEWVFATKKAPKKRTYGPRQVIETEVLALPKKTKRTLDSNDLNKKTDVELNTTKMKLLDRVRNIELFELPGKYPYEPIKTPIKTDDEEKGPGTGKTKTGPGKTETVASVKYDPSRIKIPNPTVKLFQQAVIKHLSSSKLASSPEFKKFVEYGDDGEFGPNTKFMVMLLQTVYKLPVTGNIDKNLIDKIGK